MNTRRWLVAWAGLCLAGIAATSVLNVGPYTDKPESVTKEPIPTGTHVVNCQEVADDIAQARAEVERERQEVLNPSTTPGQGGITFKAVMVPEDCADELEGRGLKGR
ncbi:hypothetical protein ACWHLZ_43685 [Streptomyces chartreusis]